MATNELFQYVRDRKRRKIGVIAAVVVDDNHFRVGYSLCKVKSVKNPSDVDKFDRETGIQMAIDRAMTADRSPGINEVPHSMQKDYVYFMNRAIRYFRRLPVSFR